jgi:transposase
MAKTRGEGRPAREYTLEFKRDAVALMHRQHAEGRAYAAIARDLGISPQLLRFWAEAAVRDERAAGTRLPPPEVAPLELEVKRLRRELERVQEERDFLKKAAAFFAKDSP